MAVVNRFNVNKQEVTLNADIIENMSANDVSYNSSLQYGENTVGNKLSELEGKVDGETIVKVDNGDKIIYNSFILSKLINISSLQLNDGYLTWDKGTPTPRSGYHYVRIDNVVGNKFSYSGIEAESDLYVNVSFFTAENVRIGGSYGGTKSDSFSNLGINVPSGTAYALLSIGKGDVSKVRAIWLSYFPDKEIYSIVSLNGGHSFVAEKLKGVKSKDMDALKSGIVNRLNQLDKNNIINGLYIDRQSKEIQQKSDGAIYLHKMPTETKNANVIGLKGVSIYTYHNIYILDADFNILTTKESFGNDLTNQFFDNIEYDNAYLAFNIKGGELANEIDDVMVLFNKPIDYDDNYQYYYEHRNDIAQSLVNVEVEDNGDRLLYKYCTATASPNEYILEIPVDGGEWVSAYYVNGVPTANGTFEQYAQDGSVIESSSVYYKKSNTNKGNTGHSTLRTKLSPLCKKLKITFSGGLVGTKRLQDLIDEGNLLSVRKDMIWKRHEPFVNMLNGNSILRCKRPLEDRVICCFGDSITDFGSSSADGGYPWYIQKNYDCACVNYARGNAHYIDVDGTDPTFDSDPGIGKTGVESGYNNVVSTQIRWCIRQMHEENMIPDVCIIGGGTNDTFANVNYGDMEASLAKYPMTTNQKVLTFYDATVYFVSKLREAFPDTKIYLSTPIKSIQNTNHQRSLLTWCEAVYNIAKRLSCEVIDFHNESGIVDIPISTSSEEMLVHNNPWYNANDGVHPSQKGVNAMARLVLSKIVPYLAE